MLDIHPIMQTLSKQRPIFHSEADFQHALAWAIHESDPTIAIRLEYPYDTDESRWHLDVWLMRGDERCAIELKYHKSALETKIGDESYRLTKQDAADGIRYGFCADIARLETIKQTDARIEGFAVLLTNTKRIWEPSKQTRVQNDIAFRLHEGKQLFGTLDWEPGTSSGTKGTKSDPIVLSGHYNVGWHDFSMVDIGKNNVFRYIAIEI